MSEKKSLGRVFYNGIIPENPTFRLVLGTCPTLAVTTSALNGLGMGAAATFVTIVQLMMQAFLPSLYESLGIFTPLIVVNCIILARAEAFASKNGPVLSAADGLGMGIGFTLALTLMGAIRELIGNGSVFGLNLLGGSYEPMLLIVLASGGFLTFGLLMGLVNLAVKKFESKHADKEGQAA